MFSSLRHGNNGMHSTSEWLKFARDCATTEKKKKKIPEKPADAKRAQQSSLKKNKVICGCDCHRSRHPPQLGTVYRCRTPTNPLSQGVPYPLSRRRCGERCFDGLVQWLKAAAVLLMMAAAVTAGWQLTQGGGIADKSVWRARSRGTSHDDDKEWPPIGWSWAFNRC